jgi:hypothetical protein
VIAHALRVLRRRIGAVGALCLLAGGCESAPPALEIAFIPDASNGAAVRVTGLGSEDAAALRRWPADDPAWRALFIVLVDGGDSATPIVGTYTLAGSALEFRPRFPFDAGRGYRARFDPSRLPRPRNAAAVETTFTLPAAVAAATTVVTGVSPGGQLWPENLLRFYIHFSAPMSRASALGYVRLEDDRGREIRDAFLPLDVDLWDPDHMRYTVFFDPGRVKRGIRPNVELGRALEAGRSYAVVIDRNWRDARGQPLAATYRYEFRAGASEERALDVRDWRVTPPAAHGRGQLQVAFPWPLDHGLLQRAIGVRTSDGAPVAGAVTPGYAERTWTFTPAEPWRAGQYQLVVLTLLEDPAGNRVGRAFEVEMLSAPQPPQSASVTIPFAVGSR